jgi:hypothetical protein
VEENIREEKKARWKVSSARSEQYLSNKYRQIVVLDSRGIGNKHGITLFSRSVMATFELEQFNITADRIRQTALEEKRLTHNPSDEELRKRVEKEPLFTCIPRNFTPELNMQKSSRNLAKSSMSW